MDRQELLESLKKSEENWKSEEIWNILYCDIVGGFLIWEAERRADVASKQLAQGLFLPQPLVHPSGRSGGFSPAWRCSGWSFAEALLPYLKEQGAKTVMVRSFAVES